MASPTKEDLENELTATKEALAKSTDKNESLEARIVELEKRAALTDEERQEIAATKEALRIQEESNVEADDRIAELEAQVGKLSVKATDRPATGDLPRVEVDGKNYQITAPKVNVKGQKLTAEKLSEDQELLIHLVEINSQILKEL